MSLIEKFPNRITVELTNSCNLLCSFCPRHLVDMKIGYMEEQLYYKIIDEIAENIPVTLVMFFRGESLLHPKIINFVKYARSKGVGPIQLASNGLLLTEEMGEELILSGLDFISFSIDTNEEDVYKKSRKNGDLQKSISNIINFVKKCEKFREQGISVPEIQVSSVDIEEYKKGQKDFIDFWRRYVDRVRVYIEHSSDGNLGSIKHEGLNRQSRKPCKKVYTDMIIYWNGDTAICNHDWNNELNIGNVKEKGIREIWNGEEYNSIRKMHENGEFDESLVCKHCDHWEMYYLAEGMLGKVYDKYGKEDDRNE